MPGCRYTINRPLAQIAEAYVNMIEESQVEIEALFPYYQTNRASFVSAFKNYSSVGSQKMCVSVFTMKREKEKW